MKKKTKRAPLREAVARAAKAPQYFTDIGGALVVIQPHAVVFVRVTKHVAPADVSADPNVPPEPPVETETTEIGTTAGVITVQETGGEVLLAFGLA